MSKKKNRKWRLLIILTLVLVALYGLIFFVIFSDRVVKSVTTRYLTGMLKTQVTIKSARYNAFQDLELNGLHIPLIKDGKTFAGIDIPRLRLVTPLMSMIEGRRIAREVIIHKPKISLFFPRDVKHKPPKSLTNELKKAVEKLLIQSKTVMAFLPAIHLKKGSLELKKQSTSAQNQAGMTILADFDFDIEPNGDESASFKFASNSADFGHLKLVGHLDAKKRRLTINTPGSTPCDPFLATNREKRTANKSKANYYLNISGLQPPADGLIQVVTSGPQESRLYIQNLYFTYNGNNDAPKPKINFYFKAWSDGMALLHRDLNKTLGNFKLDAKLSDKKLICKISGQLDESDLRISTNISNLDKQPKWKVIIHKARLRLTSGTQRLFERTGNKDLADMHLTGVVSFGGGRKTGETKSLEITWEQGGSPKAVGTVDIDKVTMKYMGAFEINDLVGQVRFNGDRIRVGPLAGYHRDKDQNVTITGTIDQAKSFIDSSHNFSINFDRYEIDDQARQVATEDEINNFWNVYNPSGSLSMILDITKAKGEITPELAYEIKPRKVGIVFRDFPYRMANINAGEVTINSTEVIIRKLTNVETRIIKDDRGRETQEKCIITLNGRLDPMGEWSSLILEAKGLELTEELYGILKHTRNPIAKQWDYLRPRGIVDLRTPVEFEIADKSSETTTITPISFDITYRDFPFPLKGISTGNIVIGPDKTTINDLTARDGDEVIRMSGILQGTGKDFKVDLNITAKDFRVDKRLETAFETQPQFMNLFNTLFFKAPPSYGFDMPSPYGIVDTSIHLTGNPEAKDGLKGDVRISLKKLACIISAFPYPITNLTGNLTFKDDRIQFIDLISREQDGSIIQINGDISSTDKINPVYNLSITCEKMPIQGKLHSALKLAASEDGRSADLKKHVRFIKSLFTRYAPRGRVYIKVDLRGPANDLFTGGSTIDIKLQDVTLRGGLDLSNLKGKITIKPNKIEMKDIKGTLGKGYFSMEAYISLEKELIVYRIPQFTINNLDLADDLPRLAANFGISGLFKGIELTGHAKAYFHVTKLRFKDGKPYSGRFKGKIKLNRAAFLLGARAEIDSADITFKGKVENGRIEVDGLVSSDILRIRSHYESDVPTPPEPGTLKAFLINNPRFSYTLSSVPGEKTIIRIYEAKGTAYGGKFSGDLRLDIDDSNLNLEVKGKPLAFSASMNVREMNLQKLLTQFGLKTNEFLGRCNISLQAQSPSPDPADVVGRCELNIYEARLYELPMILAVLNLLSLSPFELTAFNRADVGFDFYDREAHIDKFDLFGQTLSVFGTGVIKPGKSMSIEFSANAAPPVLMFIPGIRNLWGIADNSLFKIKVTGKDFNEFNAILEPATKLKAPETTGKEKEEGD